MLSIDFIRNNKDKVKEGAKNKNRQVEVDKILELDDQRRELIQKIQVSREERNKIAKVTAEESVRERGRKIKNELKKMEEELKTVATELNRLISFVPNVPLDEVPIGLDETENQEIKKWGKIPDFSFAPKSHIEIGKKLDLFDLERGTKASGFRGYFLKNEAARLHLALLFYVFNKLVNKGYTPIIAPSIVKGFTLFGSGQFPWGEKEVYKLNDEDAYLAGTAEVPVTALYANETLSEKELPKKLVAFSPCFRREAGSHGKDTKGLYRLHEFWKVEQVIIAPANLDNAKQLHQEYRNHIRRYRTSLSSLIDVYR